MAVEKGEWRDGYQEYLDIVPCSNSYFMLDPAVDDGNRHDSSWQTIDGNVTPVTDLLEAHTGYLGPMFVDDDTKVTVDQPAYATAVNVRWDEYAHAAGLPGDNTGPHWIVMKGRMAEGVQIPVGIPSVTVQGIYVIDAPGGTAFGLRGYRLDESGAGVATPIFETAVKNEYLPERLVRSLTESGDAGGVISRAAALEGRYALSIGASLDGDPVEYYVKFLGVKVSWWLEEPEPPPPVRFAAPLRQFPRSDALGTGSARRIIPTPASEQRGFRRMGGYF